MSPLIRFTAFRHLRHAALRTALTVSGLALGVALYVAIRLCNASVDASFRDTVAGLSGAATLEVIGGEDGVDEDLFDAVARTPGVVAAAPVIIRHVALDDRTSLIVLGVDLLSDGPFRSYETIGSADPLDAWVLDPTAVLLTARVAAARGLRPGETLTVLDRDRPITLKVVGVTADQRLSRAWGGAVAVMDIAAAQWTFDRVGRLDRIDVLTTPDEADAVHARLVAALPPRLVVQRPDRQVAHAQQVVRSFQVNLTALSAIALFVGLFLIYNTMTHALLRRRAEVGLLRALGVSRSRLFGALVVEAGVFGVVGGAVGVPLGWVLARAAVGTVSATVETLYGAGPAQPVVLTASLALEGLSLGCVVAVAASLVPIAEALTTVPREVLHAGWVQRRRRIRAGRLAAIGLGWIVLAWALAQAGPIAGVPVFGYGAALCLVLAGVFAMPLLTVGLGRVVRPLAMRMGWVEAQLAAGALGAAPGRTAVAAGALMTALAMMVSVVVMVGSFRRTVEQWIDATINADLYVSPASRPAVGPSAHFADDAIVGRIAAVPGVAAVDPYRQVPATDHGQSMLLSARDLTIVRERSGMQFIAGNSSELLARLARGEGIALSEVLASRLGIHAGDTLILPTFDGDRLFQVLGVFYDYATDGGRVLMDRSLWRRHWRDQGVTALAVYVDDGVDPDDVRAAIETTLAPAQRVSILSNRGLRTDVLEVFDQTFAITRALDVVAMTVAALGVAGAVLAIVMERRREIAVLRALGATRAQISGVVVWEAALIGLLGTGLGVAVGFGISVVLITVVNVQSFGWTILFSWRFPEVLAAALVALAAAVAAGWIPARHAANTPYVEALADE
ncbi:MAG TPA: FtsX-like permease family protein [Nitrospiria bacterium]|nr:FtsX-like permease family protein [Nitrospiria bacterium]